MLAVDDGWTQDYTDVALACDYILDLAGTVGKKYFLFLTAYIL